MAEIIYINKKKTKEQRKFESELIKMNKALNDKMQLINSILEKVGTQIETIDSQVEYIERQITSDFYIESINDNTTITITGLGTGVLSYSKSPSDASSWIELVISHGSSDDIIINSGERLYLKGNIDTDNRGEEGSITIGSDGPITVGGNVYSIADPNGELSKDYQCCRLFKQCSYLQNAPELPATTLAAGCYSNMFSSCTGLTTAPKLPATTLAARCYRSLFEGCTGLTTVPLLPATTLAEECYREMFSSCTGLTSVPELPATTLATGCYRSMFNSCLGLTSAPLLPATTLAEVCYYRMFDSCGQLNYVKCLATDMTATGCTTNWLRGVASTGTFVKDANTTWSTGGDGIPSGWTIEDNV